MEQLTIGDKVQVAISTALMMEAMSRGKKAALGATAVGGALAAPEVAAAASRKIGDRAATEFYKQGGKSESEVDKLKAGLRDKDKLGKMEKAFKDHEWPKEADEKTDSQYRLSKKMIGGHRTADKIEKYSPVRALTKYIKSKTAKPEQPEKTDFISRSLRTIKGLLPKAQEA